jgi:hypothetical protein
VHRKSIETSVEKAGSVRRCADVAGEGSVDGEKTSRLGALRLFLVRDDLDRHQRIDLFVQMNLDLVKTQ